MLDNKYGVSIRTRRATTILSKHGGAKIARRSSMSKLSWFRVKASLLRDWLLHERCIFMNRRSRVKRADFIPDDIID